MEPLLKLFPWLFCHSADYLNCCSFESCSFFLFLFFFSFRIDFHTAADWNVKFGNHTSSFILFMLEECFVFYKLVMNSSKPISITHALTTAVGCLNSGPTSFKTWRMRLGVVPMSWWWIIHHQCRRWSQDIQPWILFLDFQIVDLSVP